MFKAFRCMINRNSISRTETVSLDEIEVIATVMSRGSEDNIADVIAIVNEANNEIVEFFYNGRQFKEVVSQ